MLGLSQFEHRPLPEAIRYDTYHPSLGGGGLTSVPFSFVPIDPFMTPYPDWLNNGLKPVIIHVENIAFEQKQTKGKDMIEYKGTLYTFAEWREFCQSSR